MENTNKYWKIAFIILCGLLLLGLGFFAGRKTIKTPEPGVVYVPGDSIKVEVPYPVPVEVNKPVDTMNVLLSCIKSGKYYELFPERVKDSIIYVTKEDTSAVIHDWATERVYSEKVFDIDTIGTAIVNARVQYNRLTWLGSTFTPVQKVIITPQPIKKYSPFVGGGITTLPSFVVQGGLFIDDKYGISALYLYDWGLHNHVLGTTFLYKF